MSNLITYGIGSIYPQLEKEIKQLCEINKDCTPIVEKKVLPITNLFGGYAYFTATYHPQLNCIFFIPYLQARLSKWHYYSITEDKIYEYPINISSLPIYGWNRGIYDYKLNRIILTHWYPNTNKIYFIDTSSMPPRLVKQEVTPSISPTTTGGVYDTDNNIIYWSDDSSNVNSLFYSDISQPQITNNTITLPESIQHGGNYVGVRDKHGWIYSFPYNDGYKIYRFKKENSNIIHQTLDTATTNLTWLGISYIPHLNAIFLGNSKSYIDCDTFTFKPTNTLDYATYYASHNGLNNNIYYFSNFKLYSLNLSNLVVSEVLNNGDMGNNKYLSITTDTNGDIFYFNLYKNYATEVTFYKLNMNLKVKPSKDLLMSGWINL